MRVEEAFGNHMWSIHLVGAPILPSKTTSSAALLPPLAQLEEDATVYLRRGGGGGGGSGKDQAGDYVTCGWLLSGELLVNETPSSSSSSSASAPKAKDSSPSCSGEEEECDSEDDDDAVAAASAAPDARTKRRRVDNREKQQQSDKHLCVDVFLNEEWSATVIFCYCCATTTTSNVVFDLCLSRGRNKSTITAAVERILQWMAILASCHIGCKPLSLPSSDLVSVLVAAAGEGTMTSGLLSEQEQEDQQEGGKESVMAAGAPLVLTYDTHQTVPGIDTLSLTVPAKAVPQLYRAVAMEQQSESQSQSHDNGASTRSADAAEGNGDISTPTTATVQAVPEVPIVKAMECFVLKHFGMDVTQLRLCQIATATLTLGCDGRCQLHDSADALPAVRDIVVRHSRERRCGGGVRMPSSFR